MTNKELIKILKKLPKDAIIVVPGHSDASNTDHSSASMVEEVWLERQDSWRGEFREALKPKDQCIHAISIG